VEIHATTMPRLEGVTPKTSDTGRFTGRQNNISNRVALTKGGGVTGMISVDDGALPTLRFPVSYIK